VPVIDPYRTLGVTPGAPAAEIKRAYRRLVKEHHPDSAGPQELPHFLAIQAAYEMLMGGRVGGASGQARGRPSNEAARRADPASRAEPASRGESAWRGEPAWRADPARARATRDAWRRQSRGRPADESAGGSGSAAGEDGPRPTAQAGPTRGRRRHEPGQRRHEAGPRRATPGSTSYDEAVHDPAEPGWSGGSWYGQSSGTYWTINPREYADPRKHGPEYQARARRASQPARPDGDAADPAAGQESPPEPREEARPGADAGAEPEPAGPDRGPTWTQARSTTWTWAERGADGGRFGSGASRANAGDAEDRAGGAERPGETGRRAGDGAGRRAGGAATRGQAAESAARVVPPGRASLGASSGSLVGLGEITRRVRHEPANPRVRLTLALAGWPPLGLALALAIGELTGCARFAAACTSTSGFSGAVLVAQVATLAALVAVPPLARLATLGSLAIVIAALPIVAFLTAVGATYDPEPGTAALLV
jgi:molecular chaperone DnaJ